MYSKESFELLLLAINEGMRVPDAADFAGVKRRAAPCRRRGIYDPPDSGPLAGPYVYVSLVTARSLA